MRCTIVNLGMAEDSRQWMGDIYGGSLHIIPPALWLTTRTTILPMMVFIAITVLTPVATYRLMRLAFRLVG